MVGAGRTPAPAGRRIHRRLANGRRGASRRSCGNAPAGLRRRFPLRSPHRPVRWHERQWMRSAPASNFVAAPPSMLRSPLKLRLGRVSHRRPHRRPHRRSRPRRALLPQPNARALRRWVSSATLVTSTSTSLKCFAAAALAREFSCRGRAWLDRPAVLPPRGPRRQRLRELSSGCPSNPLLTEAPFRRSPPWD